jgi:prepilin-type N-terminal cleavage/methylation domain-containing protein
VTRSRPLREVSAGGFSLLEVLVATAVFVVAVVALAQLFAVAIDANARARSMTLAALLAQQKMEELVAAFSQQDVNGAILDVSPAGALDRNTSGYCDYVDQRGQSLGGGIAPPPGAAYLRRWSLDPLPVYPDSTRILQVVATRSRGAADAASAVTMRPDTTRLITVRTRRSF